MSRLLSRQFVRVIYSVRLVFPSASKLQQLSSQAFLVSMAENTSCLIGHAHSMKGQSQLKQLGASLLSL